MCTEGMMPVKCSWNIIEVELIFSVVIISVYSKVTQLHIHIHPFQYSFPFQLITGYWTGPGCLSVVHRIASVFQSQTSALLRTLRPPRQACVRWVWPRLASPRRTWSLSSLPGTGSLLCSSPPSPHPPLWLTHLKNAARIQLLSCPHLPTWHPVELEISPGPRTGLALRPSFPSTESYSGQTSHRVSPVRSLSRFPRWLLSTSFPVLKRWTSPPFSSSSLFGEMEGIGWDAPHVLRPAPVPPSLRLHQTPLPSPLQAHPLRQERPVPALGHLITSSFASEKSL